MEYTLEQINYGIAHCNHLIPQIIAEKGYEWEANLKAVQDELAVWEGYKKELNQKETLDEVSTDSFGTPDSRV